MGKRSISGLKVEELYLGTGPEAIKGKTVAVQAIGRLNKGKVFLSTYAYGTSAFSNFILGFGL